MVPLCVANMRLLNSPYPIKREAGGITRPHKPIPLNMQAVQVGMDNIKAEN